jgi:sec-independent protein translocase protein TatA
MGTFSLSHWLVVLAVVLIVFGAGRLPKAMGELTRGIRAFRTGMRDDGAAEAESEKLVERPPGGSAAGLSLTPDRGSIGAADSGEACRHG